MKEQEICRHNEKEIVGFFGEYRWLSNMWPCEIPLWGKIYPSVENAYVAGKVPTEEVGYMEKTRSLIQNMKPSEAKRFGRKMRVREDWEETKVTLMRNLIRFKFVCNPELQANLLATGNKHLEEANWWGDTFWGTYNGRGQNWLGRILMEVRESLKHNS